MFLLKSNYSEKHLKYLPKFYKELFEYAREIFCIKGNHAIIWNNECILINNNSVFWRKWYNKGIIYIYDLMKNNTFLSYGELCDKYDFEPNYLNYLSLIKAIKHSCNVHLDIKEVVNGNERPRIDFESTILKSYDGIIIDISKAKSKTFYDIFIDYDFVYPTFMQKICEDFDIEPKVYLDSLKIMKIFVKERKLLTFHYKVLNNIVASGDDLFKWRLLSICEALWYINAVSQGYF